VAIINSIIGNVSDSFEKYNTLAFTLTLLILLLHISALGESISDSARIGAYLDTAVISVDNTINISTSIIMEGKKVIDFSREQVDSLLASAEFEAQRKAAIILGSGIVIDTSNSLRLLKYQLLNEISNPIKYDNQDQSEFPPTELLKRDYCLGIIKLLENNIANITVFTDSVNGEIRARMIIWLIELGDDKHRLELIDLVKSDTNPNIRYLAAYAMNIKPDTIYIPALLTALNDDYYTIDRGGSRYYGVRINASCALMKMGYEFKRSGEYLENYTITKEPNK
jgi:hypothetical protein